MTYTTSPNRRAVNSDLLFFLVANLSSTTAAISAKSIAESIVFENDDEMAQRWEMLHFTTQEEIAADVSAVLTEISREINLIR
jgi:hypothetical protein